MKEFGESSWCKVKNDTLNHPKATFETELKQMMLTENIETISARNTLEKVKL